MLQKILGKIQMRTRVMSTTQVERRGQLLLKGWFSALRVLSVLSDVLIIMTCSGQVVKGAPKNKVR